MEEMPTQSLIPRGSVILPFYRGYVYVALKATNQTEVRVNIIVQFEMKSIFQDRAFKVFSETPKWLGNNVINFPILSIKVRHLLHEQLL